MEEERSKKITTTKAFKLYIINRNHQQQSYDVTTGILEDIKIFIIFLTGETVFLSFERKWAQYRNFLAIFSSDEDPRNYILKVDTEEMSLKIFEGIQKYKQESNDVIHENKLEFCQLLFEFLGPDIALNEVVDPSLIDRNVVLSIEVLSDTVEATPISENADAGEATPNPEKSKLEKSNATPYRLRKRKVACYDIRMFFAPVDEKADDVAPPPPKVAKVSDKSGDGSTVKRITRTRKLKTKNMLTPITEEQIYAPNFKVIHYVQNGISKSRLITFPIEDKQLCIEYFWDFDKKVYKCCGCNNGFEGPVQCTPATISQDSEGKEFVNCIKTKHLCRLRTYKKDKYKNDFVIRKPHYDVVEEEFDGRMRIHLLVYTSRNQKQFYKFDYDAHQKMYICSKCWKSKPYIQAAVCKDARGVEYISIRNEAHRCSNMKYIISDEPMKAEVETFKEPEFQHVVRNKFKLFKLAKRKSKNPRSTL